MFTFSPEMKLALTFLLTQGIKSLANLLGSDIHDTGSAIVAAAVGSILFFGEAVIGSLTPATQAAVVAAIELFTIILGSFGVFRTVKYFARNTGGK